MINCCLTNVGVLFSDLASQSFQDPVWQSESYTASSHPYYCIFLVTFGMPYIFVFDYAQIPSLHSRCEEANKWFSGLSLTLPRAFFPITPTKR